MDKNEEIKLDFFMSRITHLKDIRETNKAKLSVVLYEATGTTCILRVCKDRDMSSVCDALIKVKHPNIALVYDYVYAKGNTYILEEMLSGETLEKTIENRGAFSEKETAEIILQVINGLADFHAMKPPVIHNDINTTNIMICDDNSIKLFDFDISRTYKKDSRKNTELFGTEECASPEHYGYGQSEPRTDIYCLGVTMHRMLTGEHLTSDRTSLYKGRMKGIIEKCIKTDPKERYNSLQSLRKDLEGVLGSKKRTVNILVLFCVLAVTLAGILMILSKGQNKNNEPETSDSTTTQAQITTQGTDHTTPPSSNSETHTEQKKVTVSQWLQGKLLSMTTTQNGELVFLEKTTEGYRMKTSSGTEKILPSDFKADTCKLLFNHIREELYLVCEYMGNGVIYPVSASFEVSEDPVYTAKMSYTTDIQGMFFTDGILYCTAFDNNLIDTNAWKEYGNADCKPAAILKDHLYDLSDNYYQLDELSMNGDTLNQYDIPGESIFNRVYYGDDKNIYLIVLKNKMNYVYAFDGNDFREVACLNDYQYYTSFESSNMAVTENTLWLHDSDTNTIKEFPLK